MVLTVPVYPGQPKGRGWLQAWSTVVHELASRFGWDPQETSDALAALIDSESGWNPAAKAANSTAAGIIQWIIQPVRHQGQIVGWRKGPAEVAGTDKAQANARLNNDLVRLGLIGQLNFLPAYYARILRRTPIGRREKSSKHYAPTPWHLKVAGAGGVYLTDTSDDYRPTEAASDWILYRGDREGIDAKAVAANPHAINPETGHWHLGDTVDRLHAHHARKQRERLELPPPRVWKSPERRLEIEEELEDGSDPGGAELAKRRGGGLWLLLPVAGVGGWWAFKHWGRDGK